MSDDGKAFAERAVESLVANGATDINKGLQVASEVLADRRYRNTVTSVILLSDGQDTAASNRSGPIHTFGFGTDHDAAAMHTIAELTCDLAVIQDSFAQCIGGLLSVVVQDARIAIECVHPGVRVRELKSGRYESRIDADGRAASVDVGELYAEEERRFLLFVDVPVAQAGEDATQLVKVRCTNRDVAAGREADVVGVDAMVQRPVEVQRERARVAAAEEIAAARAAAERGAFEEAGTILQRQLYSLRKTMMSMVMQLGDDGEEDEMLERLEEELEELGDCMEDGAEYERTG
ncbi:hypothetical protein SETIT_9G230000v2 [Setaria italica]|uniref:VWFA domain-containing protein n=1 Tax=Setaria italica TaxID=4555 RepID=A0A368SJL8_SETIT|nr:hypothetical protein SETIT_9G230000v2 [Setaria italica]